MAMTRSMALLAPLSALLACDSGNNQTQPVTGKLAQATFPAPVTSVRARRPGAADILAPVDSKGAFTLSLPPGKSYRLDFLAGGEGARLVFPRKRGVLDSTFEVRGAGPAIDVGAVRYVGDARKRTFAFSSAADVPTDACEEAEELVDAQAGVVCVNDPAPGEGGSCGEVGETGVGESSGGQGTNVGETEEGGQGVVGPTGAAEGGQGVVGPTGADEGEAWVGETAVAENNLPAALGCEGESGVGEVGDEGGVVGPAGKE